MCHTSFAIWLHVQRYIYVIPTDPSSFCEGKMCDDFKAIQMCAMIL